MQSLSQREREAKIKAIEGILSCLNDSPFKFDGMYFNRRHMAEAIMSQIEQTELDFENADYEVRLANRD